MKILTWNVNGIRAILKKEFIIDNKISKTNTFINYLHDTKADIICFNETKISEVQMKELTILSTSLYPYQYHTHSIKKAGYSGVSIYSKIEPIKEIKTFEDPEGRIICLEFSKFYFIATYIPNSGSQLKRLSYRTKIWDTQFYKYIKKLMSTKLVIVAGDLNVANNDIDISKPA